MRVRSTLVFLAVPILLTSAGHKPVLAADGVLDLTWGDACTPIVSSADVDPGEGLVSLTASVFGNDRTHQAYQVRFTLGDASDQVPDAWRFDAAGCQATKLQIDHLPPENACPSFRGNQIALPVIDYAFPAANEGLPSTVMRGVLMLVYPGGQTSDPNQRYFLARFRFDHTSSVSGPTTPGVACGGVETPIVVRLLAGGVGRTSSYLLMGTGEERPFTPGNAVLTVNGAVPADRTSWGRIKGTYRR